MTTALDVIKDAMKEIQAIQTGEAPTNDEAQDCLKRLNSMLAAWELDGIAIGILDLTLSATINLPANHIDAIMYNLAVRIAPMFSATPSQITLQLAGDGYTSLQNAYGEPIDMTVDGAIRRYWYWPSGYSY